MFLALVAWGANGVRGTDQYWYLADVNSLISNNTETTNIYYAGNLLRNTLTSPETNTQNYFLHNGPSIHLVAALGKHVGEYRAWIVIGIFCHLLVALCILIVTGKYTTTENALLTSSLYIVSPIAYWQTINILQEQFFAGIMAVIYLCFHYRNALSARTLIVFTICFGIASHPIFLILGFLYTLFTIAESIHTKSKLLFLYACISGSLFIFVKIKAADFFPSSFQPDLKSIIAGSLPGESNMLYHYSPRLPEITASLFATKVKAALAAHFLDLRNAPFYIYTNIAILASVFLIFMNDKKNRTIVFLCCFTLGLYLSIIVLMQVQARYQQIVSPATFLILGFFAHHLWKKFNPFLPVTAMVFCSVLINSYLANTASTQAASQAEDSSVIRDAISNSPQNSKFVSLNNSIEVDLRLSYLIRPRKVLVLKTNYLNDDEVDQVLSLFQAEYFISSSSSGNDQNSLCGSCQQTEHISLVITKNLGDLHLWSKI